jgi:hypothetical protein
VAAGIPPAATAGPAPGKAPPAAGTAAAAAGRGAAGAVWVRTARAARTRLAPLAAMARVARAAVATVPAGPAVRNPGRTSSCGSPPPETSGRRRMRPSPLSGRSAELGGVHRNAAGAGLSR